VTDLWLAGAEDEDIAWLREGSDVRVEATVEAASVCACWNQVADTAAEGDLVIVANTDCAPDDSLALLAAEPLEDVAVCLGRWDVPADFDAGRAKLFAENGVS